MDSSEFFYKREVNKSVLYDGFGIERANLDLLLTRLPPMLRGDEKDITLSLDGHLYAAKLKNLNNPENKRKNDAYQIRYSPKSELTAALQQIFHKTYSFICEQKKIAPQSDGKRERIQIPEEYKEYLIIYTTEQPDVFLCEPIVSDDLEALRATAKEQSEQTFETDFNLDLKDESAGIITRKEIVKVRKLNRKLGQMLKEHYGYRCQICGRMIGEEYDSHLVEAHHINYFVNSLNNDLSNLLIVCPNHHGIIHDKNPWYDEENCIYTYPNGYKEGLLLNDHLGKTFANNRC